MTEEQRRDFQLTPSYEELVSDLLFTPATGPQEFYRVCVKARIRDHTDSLYLVKEDGSGWTMPGGGVSFGETVDDALRRELPEEVALTAPFTAKYAGAQPVFIPFRGAWALWLIYDVAVESPDHLGCGDDADDAAFVQIGSLNHSKIRSERLVYLWAR